MSTGRLEAEEALSCCTASIMSYLSGHKNISELSQWHFYLLQGDEESERFPWHWKYLYLELPLGMESHTLTSSLMWQDTVLTGSTVEPETSFLLTIMISGRREPVFFVSQSTRVNKKEPSWILSSWRIGEPGNSPVCIPFHLLSLHVTRGWRRQLDQKDNASNRQMVILQRLLWPMPTISRTWLWTVREGWVKEERGKYLPVWKIIKKKKKKKGLWH